MNKKTRLLVDRACSLMVATDLKGLYEAYVAYRDKFMREEKLDPPIINHTLKRVRELLEKINLKELEESDRKWLVKILSP